MTRWKGRGLLKERLGEGQNVPVASGSDDQEDGDTIHWSKNTADEVDFGGEMLTSLRT